MEDIYFEDQPEGTAEEIAAHQYVNFTMEVETEPAVTSKDIARLMNKVIYPFSRYYFSRNAYLHGKASVKSLVRIKVLDE